MELKLPRVAHVGGQLNMVKLPFCPFHRFPMFFPPTDCGIWGSFMFIGTLPTNRRRPCRHCWSIPCCPVYRLWPALFSTVCLFTENRGLKSSFGSLSSFVRRHPTFRPLTWLCCYGRLFATGPHCYLGLDHRWWHFEVFRPLPSGANFGQPTTQSPTSSPPLWSPSLTLPKGTITGPSWSLTVSFRADFLPATVTTCLNRPGCY